MPERSYAGGPEGIKNGTSAKRQIRAHYEERQSNAESDPCLKMEGSGAAESELYLPLLWVYTPRFTTDESP